MAVITPKSEIVFLKVPLTPDNKNQLNFKDPNSQFQYFRFSPGARAYDNCTYVRKDGYISVEAPFDEIVNYNYVMYQNENHSTKWYYAFILKSVYQNDNLTYVYIATDSWQTYKFDMSFKMSFIEREMLSTADDVPGANRVPEGLETGEVIEGASTSVTGMNPVYIIAFSRDPKTTPVIDPSGDTGSYGGIVNGIASGLWYAAGSASSCLGYLEQMNMVQTIGGQEYTDGQNVVAVFTVPAIALYGLSGVSEANLNDPDSEWEKWLPDDFKSPGRELSLVSTPSSIDGYTPKNKKLLTFPYTYLGFTPSNGTPKVFKYEDFTNGTPTFSIRSEVNPNPSVIFIPKNYKGKSGVNVSESSVVSGYPSVSYYTDVFNMWMAQNSKLIDLSLDKNEFNYEIAGIQNKMDLAKNVVSAVGAGATGNIGGAISGVLGAGGYAISQGVNQYNHDFTIKQTLAQKEKQSLLPNSASQGSTNTTLLGYELFNDDIFCRYSIRAEFAKKIDDYFSMYGYEVDELKLPNIDNRSNWNYVKTQGANITGANIPADDLENIKNMFNNGITFWHKPEHYLDYTQSNV